MSNGESLNAVDVMWWQIDFKLKLTKNVCNVTDALCRSLVCKKREVCVLRDAFTALCATKKDILRKGWAVYLPL